MSQTIEEKRAEIIQKMGGQTRKCEYCERILPSRCFCSYCGYCSGCCTAHEFQGEPVPEEFNEE
jgi:heterodisulfide reductase subunit C